MVDGKPGAGAEHQRLQQQAEETDRGGHQRVLVAGERLLHQHRRALALPVALHRRLHAHRADDVGVAQNVFGEHVGLVAGSFRLLHRLARHHLVEAGEPEQQHGADGRDDAEQRMDEEQQHEIDRYPRQVEREVDAWTGDEGAELIEIAQLLRAARCAALRRVHHQRLEHARRQFHVEADAAADQDAGAHRVQRRHGEQRDRQYQREQDERGNVFVEQDAVIDLHQIER